MTQPTRPARIFIGSTLAAGLITASYAGIQNHTLHFAYGLALLALASATSRMKVKLPGITGNMSVNLPFLLVVVTSLSALESVVIACVSTVFQSLPRQGTKFKPEQMVFNVSMMGFAASVATMIWHAGFGMEADRASDPVMLALATAVFFVGQTAPVAAIVSLTESTSLRRTWLNIAQLSFPYFVLSAGVASIMNTANSSVGWASTLAVFPAMYAIHRSYRLYCANAGESPRLVPLARAARGGM